MKKILFLNRIVLIESLMQKLAEQHTVMCLMRHTRKDAELSDVETRRVRYQTGGLDTCINHILGWQLSVPIRIKHFASIISDISPDVLVTFDIYHWYFLQALTYKRKNPEVRVYIYSETKAFPRGRISGIAFRFFWWYLRRNLRYIDGIIVFTEQGRRFYAEHLPDVSVTLVPAPVDLDRFYPAQDKVWLPNDTLRILMNARYESYKRHEDVLQALVRVRAQGRAVHLTCIGRAESGRDRVEKRVRELELSDCVTFLDPVPQVELPAIYHQHDVLVLPSYNEAIGMVVPEAMACGLPTITSDTVGANTYVQESETGFIFKTYDVDELTRKLEQCYDAEQLQQMGAQAYVYVTASFSAATCSEQFSTVLRYSMPDTSATDCDL